MIEVQNLVRHFGGSGNKRFFRSEGKPPFVAIDDLSFSIDKGQKVAFIGPNGAGKSTTLKVLCGLLSPTRGMVRVCGLIPDVETRQLSRRIGLVFGQRSQLWPALPVADSFDLLARIYDLSDAAYRQQKDKLVQLFGLEKLLGQSARSLSLGQRMRCDIAAALLHQPEILFLDEPTIGLDVTAKALLRDHLNHLARDSETTILLTSHDMDDVERICEKVILIDHGKKVLDMPLPELRAGFARQKTLRIITEEEEPQIAHPAVTVRERQPFSLTLSVDTALAPVDEVIALCLKQCKLQDIAIESVPLEEIIATIYARGGKR